MNTRQIISVLILMLGLIAAILPPERTTYKKWTKQELTIELKKDTYYLTTDELAHLLIGGDPSIQLIDVRTSADSLLPRAIHIPEDSILNEKFELFFDQEIRKNILYSTDDLVSQQVWMKLKLKGYPNVYMLKGGLAAWNTDILDPQHPGASASQNEMNRYSKRSAARLYFTGAKALPKTEFKVILPAGGKKKKRVAGGCS